MELTEQQIAELKQKHGSSLIAVTAPSGEQIVLRKPSKAAWADFVDTVNRDKGSRYACNERLVLSCVVYPETTAAAAVFTEWPAFAQAVSGEVATLAGAQDELAVKKL